MLKRLATRFSTVRNAFSVFDANRIAPMPSNVECTTLPVKLAESTCVTKAFVGWVGAQSAREVRCIRDADHYAELLLFGRTA